jgi:hydrogenase maturation protease
VHFVFGARSKSGIDMTFVGEAPGESPAVYPANSINNTQGETLILGVGNPLCGDDGAGVQAIKLLVENFLPPNVNVQDAGTPGLGLPLYLEGWPRVILVDAVQMGCLPGTWRRFTPQDVQLYFTETSLSLHESDLAGGLALADALGVLPETVVIYGIEPACCEINHGLSLAVQSALPEMVEGILTEIWNGK